MERPDWSIVHGTEPLKGHVDRIVGVSLFKQLPGLHCLAGLRPPIDPRQMEEKAVFVGKKRLKGEFAGGLAHERGIVAEVPALEGAGDIVVVKVGVLFVEDTWYRYIGDGGHLMGAADLKLGIHGSAAVVCNLGRLPENGAWTGVAEPVINSQPGLPS